MRGNEGFVPEVNLMSVVSAARAVAGLKLTSRITQTKCDSRAEMKRFRL